MASEGGAPREMQTESFMIHSADICEVVDRYRKEIETMKSKGVTSQYVKLLTEEDRVIEATEGVVAAYVHTSVEQFLRNHEASRED